MTTIINDNGELVEHLGKKVERRHPHELEYGETFIACNFDEKFNSIFISAQTFLGYIKDKQGNHIGEAHTWVNEPYPSDSGEMDVNFNGFTRDAERTSIYTYVESELNLQALDQRQSIERRIAEADWKGMG